MAPVILIHHHEIALKGKNRSFFEAKLIKNIKRATGLKKVIKDAGRIIAEIPIGEKPDPLIQKLSLVFGIANYSVSYKVEKSFREIKKTALELISKPSFIKNRVPTFSSFRITAHRGDKNFSLTSQEINQKLGEIIAKKTGSKVNLGNPKLEIFIEIGQKNAYISFKKNKGLGGLPVGTAGKLLCLFSGGIDSPVAAYQLIKRGANVDFIHFHSYPQTDQASIEKVKNLITVLNKFQNEAKLFLIPLLSLQKEFFKKCNHKYLTILYRRAMFKIAQEVALKENYLGLITGDSLGQVASQTLQNLAVTNQGISLPIYRPLIGEDKQEIVNSAKKIKTYCISIQPHQDCCSLFVPKHPATKAKLRDVLKEEEKIDWNKDWKLKTSTLMLY